MIVTCSFCIALCVTVRTACGDLPQHQSRGFMQVLHSNPGETSLNCAHLETCAKQILPWSSSYNDDHHLNINCPFVNYVHAASFFTALGRYKLFGINKLNFFLYSCFLVIM